MSIYSWWPETDYNKLTVTVQGSVLEQGQMADLGPGLLVPTLISAPLHQCEYTATDSLLFNSVISVAPV